ncbi:hypothetical protein PROFUN_01593 [Planoprotostelium fungivorum]|uniref:Uncharacterized protein n=1 Tax=Planoprotostelium fungivorum TaxID=1890364 RepID=A0A2P6NTQ3_9EUKA|nr:hypothetical protein PROFUN_01593 [Planoprotostelium fungivorum]
MVGIDLFGFLLWPAVAEETIACLGFLYARYPTTSTARDIPPITVVQPSDMHTSSRENIAAPKETCSSQTKRQRGEEEEEHERFQPFHELKHPEKRMKSMVEQLVQIYGDEDQITGVCFRAYYKVPAVNCAIHRPPEGVNVVTEAGSLKLILYQYSSSDCSTINATSATTYPTSCNIIVSVGLVNNSQLVAYDSTTATISTYLNGACSEVAISSITYSLNKCNRDTIGDAYHYAVVQSTIDRPIPSAVDTITNYFSDLTCRTAAYTSSGVTYGGCNGGQYCQSTMIGSSESFCGTGAAYDLLNQVDDGNVTDASKKNEIWKMTPQILLLLTTVLLAAF